MSNRYILSCGGLAEVIGSATAALRLGPFLMQNGCHVFTTSHRTALLAVLQDSRFYNQWAEVIMQAWGWQCEGWALPAALDPYLTDPAPNNAFDGNWKTWSERTDLLLLCSDSVSSLSDKPTTTIAADPAVNRPEIAVAMWAEQTTALATMIRQTCATRDEVWEVLGPYVRYSKSVEIYDPYLGRDFLTGAAFGTNDSRSSEYPWLLAKLADANPDGLYVTFVTDSPYEPSNTQGPELLVADLAERTTTIVHAWQASKAKSIKQVDLMLTRHDTHSPNAPAWVRCIARTGPNAAIGFRVHQHLEGLRSDTRAPREGPITVDRDRDRTPEYLDQDGHYQLAKNTRGLWTEPRVLLARS